MGYSGDDCDNCESLRSINADLLAVLGELWCASIRDDHYVGQDESCPVCKDAFVAIAKARGSS